MRTFQGRRPARARSGQVLILLAGALFLGGGGGLVAGTLLAGRSLGKVSVAVSANVPDEGRRVRAKQVLDVWDDETQKDIERIDKAGEGILDHLKSHDSTHAQVEARFDQLDQEIAAGVKSALARREELRGILTAEEWRVVFAP